MEVVLAFLFIGWVAAVFATSKTRAWWVSRLIPAILGIYALAQRGDLHGDIGGMQAFANAILTLAGMGLLGLSAVTLGYRVVRGSPGAPKSGSGFTTPPPDPPAIPPAYVITRGDRSSDK